MSLSQLSSIEHEIERLNFLLKNLNDINEVLIRYVKYDSSYSAVHLGPPDEQLLEDIEQYVVRRQTDLKANMKQIATVELQKIVEE